MKTSMFPSALATAITLALGVSPAVFAANAEVAADTTDDTHRTEQIVVTGSMKGSNFYADEILVKCPSKYKEEEITLRKSS